MCLYVHCDEAMLDNQNHSNIEKGDAAFYSPKQIPEIYLTFITVTIVVVPGSLYFCLG